MLGERSYSEGNATLLHNKPPFVPPLNEKKKKASIRKKINSVKSFFSDRNKLRQGSLSRNASMPDIYAAMGNGDQMSFINNKSSVKLRDKSNRNGAKLSLRPRSECLEFIDENEGLTPTMPWMRRHMMHDYSPASTISMRSDYNYRPPLMFDERDEFINSSSASQTDLTAAPSPSLLKMAESFDSLLSDGGFSLDENHNEAPLFPKFPTANDKQGTYKANKRSADGLQNKTKPIVENTNIADDNVTAQSILQRNLLIRKSKSFQHQKKKDLFSAEQTKYFSAEAEDVNREKNLPSLEQKDLKILMENEANRVLDGRSYDPKTAAKWSKEISGSIRERLRHHTSRNYKIVVNTFIGTIGVSEENVHVACQSMTDPITDRFIMVALRTDDLFVAITLLLLKY